MYFPLDEEAGVYRADFFHWVKAALVFAVIEFKKDDDRFHDWLLSHRYSSRDLGQVAVALEAASA